MRLGNAEAVGVMRVATEKLSRLDLLTLANTHGTATAAEANLYNTSATDINVALPLSQHGVDSLVAVELRNWLSSVIKAK